jgi:hypothetical protein
VKKVYEDLAGRLRTLLLQLEYAEAAQELLEHKGWKVVMATLANLDQEAIAEFSRSTDLDPGKVADFRAGVRTRRAMVVSPTLKASEIVELKGRVQGLQKKIQRLQDRGMTSDYDAIRADAAQVQEQLEGV